MEIPNSILIAIAVVLLTIIIIFTKRKPTPINMSLKEYGQINYPISFRIATIHYFIASIFIIAGISIYIAFESEKKLILASYILVFIGILGIAYYASVKVILSETTLFYRDKPGKTVEIQLNEIDTIINSKSGILVKTNSKQQLKIPNIFKNFNMLILILDNRGVNITNE
ncbi:hypothetical protein R70723_07500 [Paenibacillus sp. FSL R7-0273]|uniref:hypothetical protein n=1 Tax=Paenibacillus sp. FSL R7-0273 TaxID=1536772 RepID=UPI0004F7362B|nr:hypothetical protein [Paenibacillus sp. FSL R7-0273]AIQ45745.1 hypothetical protein R70723_07500 [Paenibacillus sp. FSL R7-0273]OMF95269.1 hypothetical protein BK144_07005 [Paenibacillus sp. FSL R7-0273]